MESGYMAHFLPKDLLRHFDIVSVKKKEGDSLLTGELEIHLDEKDELVGNDRSEFESKGFQSSYADTGFSDSRKRGFSLHQETQVAA